MCDILMNMNEQHVTLLVLLDLSAAFDTVDDEVLQKRLKRKFGFCGVALARFGSYLFLITNRSQRVLINDARSANYNLKYGVSHAPI